MCNSNSGQSNCENVRIDSREFVELRLSCVFCGARQIEYNQAFDESGPGMYKKGSVRTPPGVTCGCPEWALLLAFAAFGAHLASQGGGLDSGLSFPLVLVTLGALLRTQKEAQTHIYHVFSLTFQGLFVTTLRDGNSKPSISKMLPKIT